MREFMLLEYLYNRLWAEVMFCLAHRFLSKNMPPLRSFYKRVHLTPGSASVFALRATPDESLHPGL